MEENKTVIIEEDFKYLTESEELEKEPNIDLDKDTYYNFKSFDEFYDWVQRL